MTVREASLCEDPAHWVLMTVTVRHQEPHKQQSLRWAQSPALTLGVGLTLYCQRGLERGGEGPGETGRLFSLQASVFIRLVPEILLSPWGIPA